MELLMQRVFDLENIRVIENEVPRRTFDENGSRLGLKNETNETLRNLKKCLLDFEKEKKLSVFLKPQEIGNEWNIFNFRGVTEDEKWTREPGEKHENPHGGGRGCRPKEDVGQRVASFGKTH
jgi:hypothetical protein